MSFSSIQNEVETYNMKGDETWQKMPRSKSKKKTPKTALTMSHSQAGSNHKFILQLSDALKVNRNA